MLNRIKNRTNKFRAFLQHVHLDYLKTLQAVGKVHYHELETVDSQLAAILWAHVDNEIESFRLPNWMHGNQQQPERLLAVAEDSLKRWDGDILEIGCHEGRMTVQFAALAKQYGRRVIAVDPWQPGTQNIDGGEYEKFIATVTPYRESIDIIRASSLDPSAIAQVQQRSLAFAFVDGLHTYDACLQDILTVQHCKGYIAVDDVNWSPECRISTQRGAYLTQRKMIHHPLCREAYLLPKSSN